jgi:hypothetical protein
MWLELYWGLFAHKTVEAGGSRLLQNHNLPILEVNAGYGVRLDLLDQFCALNQRPCIQVSDQPLASVLHHLTRLKWLSSAVDSVYIEQVPWTQANLLAQAWCNHHCAQMWYELVTLEIVRAMQTTPSLCAYVALEGNTPVGMALVMPTLAQPRVASCAWWAGERRIAQALFARACLDFSGLEVVVPADWGLGGEDIYISHVFDERNA